MKIYHYDAETFEYIYEGVAVLDPIESKALVPAQATTIKPPEFTKAQAAIFDEKAQKWIVKEDHREAVAYSTDDGQQVEIKELGKLPSNVTLTPRPSEYHSFSKGKWIIKAADAARKKSNEDKAHNQQVFEQIEQLEKKQQRPLREAALATKATDKNAALARVKAIDDQVEQLRATLKTTK